ncbi:D-3-phosphoglycerate dehydrogenase [Streptomyces sp. NBC_00510]
MTKPTALVLMERSGIPGSLLARLESAVSVLWLAAGQEDTADVRLLVTANAELNSAYLRRFPVLGGIVLTGTAADYVDLDHCREHGIVVSNTPSYTGSSVAEHALALALASNRYLLPLDAATRTDARPPSPLARELAGKVAGIIGLGEIGGRLATLLRGLDLRVLFVNRSRREHPGAEQVELDRLLMEADFVFLTLPLTPQTFHLLDAQAFALMRPTARVVNVSADELIDPAPLAAALRNGRIAGAALDVIGSPAPFLDLPNTILTPTCGWYTQEAVYRRAETWVETVQAFVAGSPRYVVS